MVALSGFLDQHRRAVVAAWAAQLRTSEQRAALSEVQLRDAMELFLDELVETLDREEGPLVRERRSAVTRAHGRHRHTLRYPIGDVIREYALLFEVIIDLAAELGVALEPRGLRMLARCLSDGAAEAADEFAKKSAAELRQSDIKAFAFLAHEIRNPLSSAKLSWELIQRTTPVPGENAERLGRSLERVTQLLDHSLTQSQLMVAGDRIQLHRELVSIEPLLREAAEDSAAEAKDKGIEMTVHVESNAAMLGDARLLRSAVSNLVRNAVKFTHSGGTVRVSARSESDQLRIEVEDRCGGLPLERAEHLFEAFIQAQPGGGGYGLGLAIVRQAVEAHSGTVSVFNQPGLGCTFVVELPCGAPSPSPQA